MAYYTALIAAWNSATQPPVGVTGTALTGLTTANKIIAVNGWTVSNPQPANVRVTDIIAAIVPADFLALTALQLQQLQFLLQSAQIVFAPPSGTVRSVFSSIFTGKTTTLNNLSALVAPFDTATQSWCAANGYPTNGSVGNLSLPDANNAGLV
jgi:hypothetical protein